MQIPGWAAVAFSGIGVAFFGWLVKLIIGRFREIVGVRPSDPHLKVSQGASSGVQTGFSPIEVVGNANVVLHGDANVISVTHSGSSTIAPSENYRPRPSAHEITSAVRGAIPFNRTQIQSNYINQKVNWRLEYRNLSELSDNRYLVHAKAGKIQSEELKFDFDQSPDIGVWFSVNLSDVPEFKTMKIGQLLSVKGEISSVSAFDIDLRNVSVTIQD